MAEYFRRTKILERHEQKIKEKIYDYVTDVAMAGGLGRADGLEKTIEDVTENVMQGLKPVLEYVGQHAGIYVTQSRKNSKKSLTGY